MTTLKKSEYLRLKSKFFLIGDYVYYDNTPIKDSENMRGYGVPTIIVGYGNKAGFYKIENANDKIITVHKSRLICQFCYYKDEKEDRSFVVEND